MRSAEKLYACGFTDLILKYIRSQLPLYSYPPLSMLLRTYVYITPAIANDTDYEFFLRTFRALEDAILPLFTPITGIDGCEMHEILVPKNTTVILSLLNSNRDPTLWGPDSYEWKPERWLAPLPDMLTQAPIPGIYSHL